MNSSIHSSAPSRHDALRQLFRKLGKHSGATVVALCLLASTLSHASDIPWRKERFDLKVDSEPLNVFLGRMLTLHGIAATMSPPIATAKINGRFRGPAETVFRELADTYGLIWYYDGSVLHIYSLAEMESRLLQVGPADVSRIERALIEMHLQDNRYPLKISSTEGQVLVSGPPHYVQLVSDVVNQVASSPSQGRQSVDTRVFRLRHARAADTVVSIAGSETTIPGVARILGETLGLPRVETGSAPNRTLPATVVGLRGKGQRAIGRTDDTANAETSASPTATNTSYPAGESSRSGGRSNEPFARDGIATGTAGPRQPTEAAVRADPRLNAVVIRDSTERMPMYARLIADLDVEAPLLEIEATVIDVAEDKSEQLGIDWRLHGSRADIINSPNRLAGTGQGTPNAANDLLFTSQPLSSASGLVGTLLFGDERNYFLARLNAMTERGEANLISKPRVLTLDNTEAVLQSTREFFVRIAGRDQVDLFNVTLGLVLRVTPTLIEDEQGTRIKLNIRIEDGNTNSGAQVDQIPVVNRNAIATQAVVGDGHSLLIGGYVIEEKNRNDSGVPGLSDVPGLRWLFGQKATSTKRVERIFLITPRLVKTEAMVRETKPSALPSRVSTPSGVQ